MKDARETLILVDAEDREIGIAEKLDAHRRGALHRAFSVIIRDGEGRMLLQKRHREKYHSGGLWTNACCGHPRPGEETGAAALRRLREEMGFTCPLHELGTLTYHAPFENGLIEHELVHIYGGVFGGHIAPATEEIEDHGWRTLDEIRQDVAAHPGRYTVWFRAYVAADWPVALKVADAGSPRAAVEPRG